MSTVVLHLKAKHDVNGNPQRLYLVVDEDTFNGIGAVIKEGYSGTAALRQAVTTDHYTLIAIEVTKAEYRDWVAFGKHGGILTEG